MVSRCSAGRIPLQLADLSMVERIFLSGNMLNGEDR